MAGEKQFHVGIKGMIKNAKGQILLMHEDVSTHSIPLNEYWDFPGGRMEEGETTLDTLRREIQEETGITDVTDPTFVTAVISKHKIKLSEELTVGLVLMVYTVTIPADAKIELSHEHTDYEWVSMTEAKKRLTHKYPAEFTDAL